MSEASSPTTLSLSSEELKALVARVRQEVSESDARLIETLAENYQWFTSVLAQKNTSLGRLRRMLFGAPTEKSERVLGTSPKTSSNTKAKKGHGRRAARDYPGARVVKVPHENLQAGDPCPACFKGRLSLKAPRMILRIQAQPILAATRYEMEKFRCNLCGKIFGAQAPEEAGTTKYDRSVATMLVVLRYGIGLPNYRLEKLQHDLGVPLAASTQWELSARCAGDIGPLYRCLLHHAAQAELLYNDDTTMRVLSLKDRSGDPTGRTGTFTTGVVAQVQGRRIALFFTGTQHAGENLNQLLQKRLAGLPPPMQMCDGLSRNQPKEHETLLLNCLIHGRRNFVDVAPHFPDQCAFLLESLRHVYHHDAQAREKHLNAAQRLKFHQTHSAPVMHRLKEWLDEQIQEKKCEPNSGLGGAVQYMLKRWVALTRFLEIHGAPLDNNICERMLKRAILHRKNSMFYNTQKGADVGDLFMSLIHTCRFSGVDPFHYLNALQDHAPQLESDTDRWLPWNYLDTLRSLDPR